MAVTIPNKQYACERYNILLFNYIFPSRKGTKEYMKDTNKYTKDDVLSFVKERVTDNNELFTKEEINIIKNNINIFGKIYLMAVIDMKM